MTLLTDEDMYKCYEAARKSYRHSQSQIRGQQLGPADDPDYHLARAIETAVLEKLKAQELTTKSAYQRGYIDGKGSDTKRITELEAQNAKLAAALKLIATVENSALDLAYCKGIARAALAKQEVKT